ncbi:MAG: Ig-like domain-containing protein [Taibaiella sp.]|nr:Ig-like domain-containing protein [Taibaiella sp.]
MKKVYPSATRLNCHWFSAFLVLSCSVLVFSRTALLARISDGLKRSLSNADTIQPTPKSQSHIAQPAKAAAASFKKQLSFIENKGQIVDQNSNLRHDIDFALPAAPGLNVFVGNGALHYQFSKAILTTKTTSNDVAHHFLHDTLTSDSISLYRLDVELVGANPNVKPETLEPQAYYERHYTSNVTERGAVAHTFNRIIYRDIYPHIDWVLYTSGGKLKHEFHVHPGGRVSDIKLKYGGATNLAVDKVGAVTATTPMGDIVEQAPVSYTTDHKSVGTAFSLHKHIISYSTQPYKGELVIDPTLEWATYFGGPSSDYARSVAIQPNGNICISGHTNSTSGIATVGAYQTSFSTGAIGNADAFLAVFTEAGSLLWATYLGGTGNDFVLASATDDSSNIYIGGVTNSSSGMATSGAAQTTAGGSSDGFLARFGNDGSLHWCSYFGGGAGDYLRGLATDSANVYITGYTGSTSGIATAGVYQSSNGGMDDAFIAKFNSIGHLQWASYFGGPATDLAYGLAASHGRVMVAGETASTSGIASSGAYLGAYVGGSRDGFVAEFNAVGTLTRSTYLGGAGQDHLFSVAIANDAIYLAGYTGSAGITTAGAYQPTLNGTSDGWLMKLSAEAVPVWSTYFGGDISDELNDVSVHGANVFVGGSTISTTGIATPDGFQLAGSSPDDGYLGQFDTLGHKKWSSFYGGAGDDGIWDVAATSAGNLVIAGLASVPSTGLTTAGAYHETSAGGSDALLGYIDFARAPIIDSVSPIHAHPGEHTTIIGRHFNPITSQNIVHFGATYAAVNYASDTMLDVTVPIGATFEAITVLNAENGRMGFAPKSFLPTYDNTPFVPGMINFDTAVNFLPTTDTTTQLYIDDVDGDGKADIVARCAGLNISQVRFLLYRNISTAGSISAGSFASPVTLTAPSVGGLGKFLMADIDGDGKKDIVGAAIVGAADIVVYILRNQSTPGTFSFANAVRIDVDNISDLACDDIDGDGRPEIVIAAYTKLSLIRNRCSPGNVSPVLFETPVDFPCLARNVTTGDADGDGHRDIILTDSQPASSDICIFRNVATVGKIDTTSLATPVLIPAPGVTVSAPILEDFDCDGKNDIILGNTISGIKSITVFQNIAATGTALSTATFGAAQSVTLPTFFSGKPILADIDGDAKPDVVSSTGIPGTICVMRNVASPGIVDSTSFAAPVSIPTGTAGSLLVAGDLDGDAKPDVCISGTSAISGFPPKLVVLRNNPLRRLSGMRLCPGDITIFTSNVWGGTWSSSNSSVATIDASTGSLLASAAGTASITYTINTGFTSAIVTVDAALCSGPGIVTTVAGSGAGPVSGVGGAAFNAHIGKAKATVKDNGGNIYVANDASQIFKVTGDGILHIFAGTATSGYTGDGGPATAARIGSASHMALDNTGSLYFTDTAFHCIRMVSSSGIITTIAGTGTAGYSADGTAATASSLTSPSGIAIDSAGRIFFRENKRIRMIDPATGNALATVAGNGTCPASGDGGVATAAAICDGEGIAVDISGKIALTTQASIRQVDALGFISTIAGTGGAGFTGDGGPATAAQLDMPDGLAYHAAGTLVVADQLNNRVRKLLPGGNIETLAGNGSPAFNGDGCPATTTTLNHPADVFADAWGKIYVADYDNYRVRVITANHNIAFAQGAVQFLSVSSNDTLSLDTALSVTDGDNLQPLTWSVISGPVNGTLSAAGTQPGNGSTYYPFGFSYSPDGGFSGYDSFRVRVIDCAAADDTTTVYVTVTGDVPIVYSVSPNPARPGDTVTISGLNFNGLSALDVVYFGATRATITTASTDTIIAIVPLGATYQSVSVTNLANGLTGSSRLQFLPTFDNSPFVPGIVNFDSVVSYDLGVESTDIAAGDIDGDGKADLAFVSPYSGGSRIHVMHNVAAPGPLDGSSFSSVLNLSSRASVAPFQVALKDIDGDGKLDMITSGASSGMSFFSVFRNVAAPGSIDSSSFETRVDVPTGTNEQTIGIACEDLNNDGKPDIVCTNLVSGTISIFQNNCTPGHIDSGSFVQKVLLHPSTSPKSIRITDIDGDGKKDIVALSPAGSSVQVARNQSLNAALDSSSFATPVSFSAGVLWGFYSDIPNLPVGDLNNDGHIDVLAPRTFGTDFYALENTASPGSITGTSLSSPIAMVAGGFCSGMAISDFNGDGSPDISLTRHGPSYLRILRNAGLTGAITSTSFILSGEFPATLFAYRITTADIDNDALSDVIVANNWNGAATTSISIFRNDPLRYITGATAVCVGATTTLVDSTLFGKWYSSNAAIATVDSSTGVVTGIAPGTALISYVVRGGQTNITITVDPAPSPAAIAGDSVLCAGTTSVLSNALPGGTWSVSAPATAAIDVSGTLTGLSGGTSFVSYTLTNACGSAFTTRTVTINPLPDTGTLDGSSILCLGATMLYSDTTLGGAWSSSDPSVASIDVAGMATGISAGTSTISYATTNGCGTLAATRVVTVTPAPDAGAILGPATVCVGGLATLTATAPGGAWSSTVPSKAVINLLGRVIGLSTGTTTISYALNNGCGIAYTSRLLTVVAPGVAPISGPASVCTGVDIILACASVGGTWSSPSANVAVDSATGAVTGVSAGTGVVSYLVVNGCGTSITTKTITVNQSPFAGVLTGSGSVCVGSSVIFYNAVPGGTWSSSNAAIATAITPGLVTGIAAGTASVSYTVTNACGAGSATKTITVNPLPDAGSISGTMLICPGAVTALSSSTSGGNWSSANMSVATISAGGLVTGVAPGTATVSYLVSNICGTAVTSVVVTVNPYPSAGIISGPSSICEASTATFSSPVPGGVWSSSAVGVASVSATGEVAGITTGAARISYSVTNMCGGATATVNVNVMPLPIAGSISGSPSVCAGTSTMLSVSSVGGVWSSSAPLIASVSAAGQVTGNNAGTCLIYYTVSNGCGIAVATHLFTVNPLSPAGFIVGPAAVCLGSSTVYSDAVAGGTWTSSQPTVASIDASGNVSAISVGTSRISYTTTNSCGSVSVTRNITVSPVPAAISGPDTLCEGSEIYLWCITPGGIFTGGTGVASLYNLGGGNARVVGIDPGTVTIRYNKDGCYSEKTITVNSVPSVAPISGPAYSCPGSAVTFTVSSTGGAWNSSNASVLTIDAAGSATAISAGTASVTYSVTNSCGTAASARTITVYPFPDPGLISGPSSVCAGGGTITLTHTGMGSIWSSANSSIATVTAPGIVTGVNAGTVTISYTVSNLCGTVFATKDVTVQPLPDAGILAGTTAVCQGSTTTFTSTTPGGTWTSENPAVASVDLSSGVITGMSPGAVYISYTAVNGCGTSLKRKVVTVNPLADAGTISGTPAVCIGSTLTLGHAPYPGDWSSGNPSVATISSTGIVSALSAGVADISYTVTNSCSAASATLQVSVNTIPDGSISPSTITLCPGESFVISPATPAGTWTTTDAMNATVSPSGNVVAVNPGTALISYRVSNICGTVGSSALVTVSTLPNAGAIFGPSTVCSGNTATLINPVGPGTWSSSAPATISVNSSGNVLGLSPGTTTISFSVTNSCGTAAATKQITVNQMPTSITGPTSLCEGQSTTFTCSAFGGTWSSSSASISVDALSGTGTAAMTGIAVVTYTLPGGCIATHTVTVAAQPASVSGALVVCEGDAHALIPTPSDAAGSWVSSDNSIATFSGWTLHGHSAGTASISYTTAQGCSIAATITVQSTPKPITGPTAICEGSVPVYSSLSSGGVWSSNTSAISVHPITGVAYASMTGAATIAYKVGNCSTALMVSVNVQPAPIAGSLSVCEGAITMLDNLRHGGTWSSSDPSVADFTAPLGQLHGNAVGTATVSYTLGNCTVTALTTVQPLPSPIIGDTIICVGATGALSSSTPGGTWIGGGSIIAHASGIIAGVAAGTGVISYVLPTGCSTGRSVTANPLPGSIGGPLTLCEGLSGTFSISGVPGGTWSSSNPAIASADGLTGVIAANTHGMAVVSYVLPTGCAAFTTVTVQPSVTSLSVPAALCEGSTSFLSGMPVGGTWRSDRPGIADVTPSGSLSGVSVGTVFISYWLHPSCPLTDTISIRPLPTPVSGTLTACVNDTAQLYSAPAGGSWMTSGTSLWMSATGAYSGVSAGTTTVTYTSTAGCSRTTTVTVNTLPAAISGPASFCKGTGATLASATPGGIWSVNNPLILSIDALTGAINAAAVGTSVISYVLSNGCAATYKMKVLPTPQPIAGVDRLCEGTSAKFKSATHGGSWSTTSGAITVDAYGVVAGISPGAATISYALPNGCSTAKNIEVDALPATPALTGDAHICNGDTAFFEAYPMGGTWSTSEPSFVNMIAQGTFQSLLSGKAPLFYQWSNACGSTSASVVLEIGRLANAGTITGDAEVCLNKDAHYASSEGGGYWISLRPRFGNIDALGNFRASEPGTALLGYVAKNECSTDTARKYVEVNGPDKCDTATRIIKDFNLYPNPSKGAFIFESPLQGTLHIYSADSRSVARYSVISHAIPISLPAELPAGIYMVRFIADNGTVYVAKLVVSR